MGAVTAGAEKIVEFLLLHNNVKAIKKELVDAEASDGKTALHIASYR